MSSKTFKTTIVRDGPWCFIPLDFDPRAVFGKARAPVRVTLKGYTYRSTIAAMGGPPCIPLRKSHRAAAGLEGGETIVVRLDLDTEKRDQAARRLREGPQGVTPGVGALASAQLHPPARARRGD